MSKKYRGAPAITERIMAYLRANPGDHTPAGLAGHFGCNTSTAYVALCRLRDVNEVTMNGTRHNVTWTVRDTAPPVDFRWDLLPPVGGWVGNLQE